MPVFRILLICSIVCLLSCNNAQQSTSDAAVELPFFDLKSYFTEEISKLTEQNPTVQKQVAIDGQTEEQELQNLDFEQELQSFLNADINRQAWYDKYQIDSTVVNNELAALKYTALEEDLKIRNILIEFGTQQQVKSVAIESSTESFVASSRQLLAYKESEGYSIQTSQGTAIGKTQDIKVEITFVKIKKR